MSLNWQGSVQAPLLVLTHEDEFPRPDTIFRTNPIRQLCGQEKTCGSKHAYESEGEAERAAQAHNRWSERRHDVEPYPCAFCRKWHIGRVMPPEAMEAIITGADGEGFLAAGSDIA